MVSSVLVVQADNRLEMDYLALSRSVNQRQARRNGYDYAFVDMNDLRYSRLFMHPATAKIHVVRDILKEREDTKVIVFLDTDAWIQNARGLHELIQSLEANERKHGCFSRDPYLKRNTYVNSGSFVIKNDAFIRCMYEDLVRSIESNPAYLYKWPYDQYYVSNFVYENREHFDIYVPDALNTPTGKVLRHNWFKNRDMFDDLKRLEYDRSIEESVHCELDDRPFPNDNQ